MKTKNVLIREIFSLEEAADYLDQSDFIYTTKIWIDYLRIQTKGTPVFLLLTIESKQALFVGVIFNIVEALTAQFVAPPADEKECHNHRAGHCHCSPELRGRQFAAPHRGVAPPSHAAQVHGQGRGSDDVTRHFHCATGWLCAARYSARSTM